MQNTFFRESLIRTMIPFFTAVVFGHLIHASDRHFSAVATGECAVYTGTSEGNDPSQHVMMTICRDHNQLTIESRSKGIGGTSVMRFDGVLNPSGTNEATLVVTEVFSLEPNPGWIACHDDVLRLQALEDGKTIVGYSTSHACSDRARLTLYRDCSKLRCSHF